jgi:chromosome partitioning protein
VPRALGVTHEVTGTGHYAEMVCEAQMRRCQFDQGHIDSLDTRPISASQHYRLGIRLGLRDVEGCAERIVYRQFFPSGLTALAAASPRRIGGHARLITDISTAAGTTTLGPARSP